MKNFTGKRLTIIAYNSKNWKKLYGLNYFQNSGKKVIKVKEAGKYYTYNKKEGIYPIIILYIYIPQNRIYRKAKEEKKIQPQLLTWLPV